MEIHTLATGATSRRQLMTKESGTATLAITIFVRNAHNDQIYYKRVIFDSYL